MRVLLISPSYHPVLGGLQTVTHQVARALLGHGHQVRVVSNRYPRNLPARETMDGVPVERWTLLNSFGDLVRNRRPDLALASVYFNPAAAHRLARLLADFRPHTVNLHFPEPRTAAILELRHAFEFRLVVSLHGDEVERWFPAFPERPGRGQMRALLRSADAVTACSGYLLRRAMDLEPAITSKGRVIHNGVDGSRFLKTGAHPHPRPYAFAYGRLTHKKGFDLLLKAFRAVSRQHPDLDLLLAGAGEESDRVLQLREELDLKDRVVTLGRATPEEVVRLLKGCRLAVVPSRQEPFGIVAAEVLLAGRPLVATQVGGLPEVVEAFAAAAPAPVVYWAKPDAPDLQRAMLAALAAPDPPRASIVTDVLTFSAMARRYERVLQGNSSWHPWSAEMVGIHA